MIDNKSIGLIVFAHGSRVSAANEAVRQVAREASSQAGISRYCTAFLELAEPSLLDAVEALAADGVKQMLVTPYFLTMGRHLTEDLPRILGEIKAKHPDLQLVASPPLDGHPQLAGILAERARVLIAEATQES